MNYLIASILGCAGLLGGQGAAMLMVADLDSHTSIPIGSVLGSAATVLLVGMWVSAKVTKFEEQLTAVKERLDKLERIDSRRHG